MHTTLDSFIFIVLTQESISHQGLEHERVVDFGDMAVDFPGYLVSSTNKTDHHDINEILLKVTLNTIILTPCTHTVYLLT